MFSSNNLDFMDRVAEERWRDCTSEHRQLQLLKTCETQRGWPMRQVCRVLHRLGCGLVGLGRRLQAMESDTSSHFPLSSDPSA